MDGRKSPTRLSRGLRKAMDADGFTTASDAAQHWGIGYSRLCHWISSEEPAWLVAMRRIKRMSGLTWDELLDGRKRL